MNCPCCNKEMRHEKYYNIHVCDCQGKLLELVELERIAKVNVAKACPVVEQAQETSYATQEEFPATEFITLTIPSTFQDRVFLSNNHFYLDFKNKVWFKKIRNTDYPVYKNLLDQNKVQHTVLAA